jgi:hypothetical protein
VIRPKASRAVCFPRGLSYEIEGGYGVYVSAVKVQDEYFCIGRVRADSVSLQTAICAHMAVMSHIFKRARSADEQRNAVLASRDHFQLAISFWHQHADQAKVRVHELAAYCQQPLTSRFLRCPIRLPILEASVGAAS